MPRPDPFSPYVYYNSSESPEGGRGGGEEDDYLPSRLLPLAEAQVQAFRQRFDRDGHSTWTTHEWVRLADMHRHLSAMDQFMRRAPPYPDYGGATAG